MTQRGLVLFTLMSVVWGILLVCRGGPAHRVGSLPRLPARSRDLPPAPDLSWGRRAASHFAGSGDLVAQ